MDRTISGLLDIHFSMSVIVCLHGGVNEQPFKLGALMARVTEKVKERTFHLQRMQECYRK